MTLREEWERNAEDWIRWARTPGHDLFFWRINLPTLLSLLPPPGRLTVDVGCGEGRFGRELRRRGHRVVGVDGSATLARAAATHLEPIPVVLADAARLPLQDGAADLVTNSLSLHDFDDMPGAVGEVARVLTPDGAFCFGVVHPINAAGDFAGENRDGAFVIEDSYFQSRRYTFDAERAGLQMRFESIHHALSDYAVALENAGFVIEAIREPAPDPSWTEGDPSRIEKFSRIPISLHVRARKA